MIEKKDTFEIDFFFQTIEDDIYKYSFLKNDYIHSLKFASNYKKFDFDSFLYYTDTKHGIIINYISNLNTLINKTFKEHFAEPGIPSDLKEIYYVSNKYGNIYQDILKWAIEFYSLIVDDELEDLRDAYSILPRSLIAQLEEFPKKERINQHRIYINHTLQNTNCSTQGIVRNRDYLKKLCASK